MVLGLYYTKKYNNYGKLQLIELSKHLEKKGYDFWNLGHPYMDYKFQIGAKKYSRNDFLNRWHESINKKYGEYLPNLLDEKSTLEDIKEAYENISIAMRNKAIEQFKAQDIQEATEHFVEEYKDAVSDFESKVRKKTGSDIQASLGTQALKDYALMVRTTREEILSLTDYSDPTKNREQIDALIQQEKDAKAAIVENYGISQGAIMAAAGEINKIYAAQERSITKITSDYEGMSEGMKKAASATKELTTEQKEALLQETIADDMEKELTEQLAKFKEYETAKDVLSEEELKKRYETQVKYGGDERDYLKSQLKKDIFQNKYKYDPYFSMEFISYDQTKKYGKKVLGNYLIYNNYLNEKEKLTTKELLQKINL